MEYGYQRVINDSFEHVETRTRESIVLILKNTQYTYDYK